MTINKFALKNKDDATVCRLVTAFVFIVVFIFMNIFASNAKIENEILESLQYIRIFAAILLVLSAAYMIIIKIFNADEERNPISSRGFFLFSAFFAFCSYIYDKIASPATVMIILALIFGVMYFVYHIYKRIFFIISAICFLSAFGIYLTGLVKIGVLSKGISIFITYIILIMMPIMMLGLVFLHIFSFENSIFNALKSHLPRKKDINMLFCVCFISFALNILVSVFAYLTIYAIISILTAWMVIGIIYTIEALKFR